LRSPSSVSTSIPVTYRGPVGGHYLISSSQIVPAICTMTTNMRQQAQTRKMASLLLYLLVCFLSCYQNITDVVEMEYKQSCCFHVRSMKLVWKNNRTH
jgi:hypothetical protein